MLLVTAKMNNNTGWWWVGQYTHNVVKLTFTWLWLSWVLTICKDLDFVVLLCLLLSAALNNNNT